MKAPKHTARRIKKRLGNRRIPRSVTKDASNGLALLSNISSHVFEPVTAVEVVEADPHLLERARIQWQFGDWENLAQLAESELEYHPDRAKLALLTAAGLMQIGDTAKARTFVRLAQD